MMKKKKKKVIKKMSNTREHEISRCEELLKENLSPSEKYAIKCYLKSIK